MSKILVLVVRTDDGCVETHYGVSHEGKLWVVTSWLMDLATNRATPERMIRVDTQQVQQCAPGGQFDYSGIVLPRELIEDTSADLPGYEIRDFPDAPSVDRADLKILPSVFPRH